MNLSVQPVPCLLIPLAITLVSIVRTTLVPMAITLCFLLLRATFILSDVSLVERIGGKVKVIAGDRRNLKITFPIDLRVAEMILEEGSFDVPQ